MTTFVNGTTISAAFLNACALVVEAASSIALAGVTPATNTLPYFDSATTASSTSLSAFARTLLDDTSSDDARTTLGALPIVSPAATSGLSVDTNAFVVRTDGHSGFGYADAPEVFTANRRYVTLMGSGVATGDGAGVLQFRSNAPEGTNVVGVIEFIDPNNTSGNKRVGYIANTLAAGTANNRGSYITLATRPDAGTVAVEAMRISSTGSIGIGTTVTGSGDRFRLGDGTSSSIMRLLGNSGANGQAELKLTRDSISTWAIGYGGASTANLTFALGPSDDTEAALATAALFTLDGFGLASFGSHAPNTAKLLVSTATSVPSTPTTGALGWFVGPDTTAASVGLETIGATGELHMRRANGTMAVKTQAVSGNVLGQVGFAGYDSGNAFGTASAAITAYAGESFTGAAHGTYLTLSVTAAASTTLTERMRINDNGKIVIGALPSTTLGGTRNFLTITGNTTGVVAPAASTLLHLIGADGGSGCSLTMDSYGGQPVVFFRRSAGTFSLPTAVQTDDNIGGLGCRPYNGTAWETASRALISCNASENWTNTAVGTYIAFSTTNTGGTTTSQKMKLYPNGALAIASTTLAIPAAATLLTVSNNAVSGSVPSNLVYLCAADGTTTVAAFDSSAAASTVLFRRANTSIAAPSALAANDNIGAISGRGYGATGYSAGSRVSMAYYAAEAWTDTAHGTYITFNTTPLTTATLTEQMRIADNGDVTLTSKIISYNGVATVGNGVPALVAKSLLTAQTAAIAATTIYAVPASGAGVYRISFVASITTAATTSSGLGGLATTGFKVIYTSPTDSVVKTSNPNSQNNHTVTAANATTTTVSGVYLAYCKASTNLQYSYDYASVNANEMNYELSIFVEYLGA